MLHASELRLGNCILQKVHNKIVMVPFSYSHFDLLAKGETRDLFPVLLKGELLEKCGFTENKKYALLPDAHEYILTLPVPGNNKNEIAAYVKNNKECFARAMVNNLPVSSNINHLHQLQNLYFALIGKELEVKLK